MSKLSTADRKDLVPTKAPKSGKPITAEVKKAVKKNFPSMGAGGGLKGFVAKKGMV